MTPPRQPAAPVTRADTDPAPHYPSLREPWDPTHGSFNTTPWSGLAWEPNPHTPPHQAGAR